MSRPGKTEQKVLGGDFQISVRTDRERPDDVELYVSAASRSVLVVLDGFAAGQLGAMLNGVAQKRARPISS